MRKYILTLLTVFLLSTCTTAFAGRNVITNFKGTIKSVSLIHQDGTEYQILAGDRDFGVASQFSINVTAGPGNTIPYGDYTGVKYVFKNDFEFSGYVELTNSGANNGRYNTNSINSGKVVFEKDGSLNTLQYKYTTTNTDNWDEKPAWCTVVADANDLTITENINFTITEDRGKLVNVGIALNYLWFGADGAWTNFDETTYVNGSPADEPFTLAGTTLTSPFLDPPEMEIGQ